MIIANNKYKAKYDWVRKVINKKLCKRLKLDHTDKWYIYKPESEGLLVLCDQVITAVWRF